MKLIKKKKTFPAFLSSYKKTSENFEKARDCGNTSQFCDCLYLAIRSVMS